MTRSSLHAELGAARNACGGRGECRQVWVMVVGIVGIKKQNRRVEETEQATARVGRGVNIDLVC